MSAQETPRSDRTLSDPEAGGCVGLSLFAFWLRHPEADGHALPATIPEYLQDEFHLFTRYGWELEILEEDLTDCIGEFRMACEHYYVGPSFLRLKKFAVVYHVDNFYVRVHKLIENVYGLSACLSVSTRGESPYRGSHHLGSKSGMSWMSEGSRRLSASWTPSGRTS